MICRFFFRPALGFAVLAALAPLFAAEHRISSAADFARLTPELRPGDGVVLVAGTWKDQSLVFRAVGTAAAPITLRAEQPGKTILTGNSRLLVDGEWLVVDGLFFKDGGPDGDGIALKGRHHRLTATAVVGGTYKFFVHLYGFDHRVDRCYFADKTSADPTFQIEVAQEEPNRHRLERNHFGPRPPLGRNGGETIRIGYSGQSMSNSRTVVEENLFDRCDGEIEIISSKSCENVYRANTFRDCAGMLTLRHGNRCVIDGNFFLGGHKRGSGGIRVIGEDHTITNNYIEGVAQGGIWLTSGVPHSKLVQYFQARRCVVAFNTIVDSRGPCLELDAGIGGSGRTMRPAEITVAHNLFAVAEGETLFKGTEGAEWRWRGNFASGAVGSAAARDGVRIADLRLRRAADGLLRPAADSPVCGTADDSLVAIATDIDGQPRGKLSAAGCDEPTATPALRRPLLAADTGPAWLAR
jgi:poly(beta-D-mannuronate) lyase